MPPWGSRLPAISGYPPVGWAGVTGLGAGAAGAGGTGPPGAAGAGSGTAGLGRARGAAAGLGRAGGAALGQELHGALEGYRIHGVGLAEGGVGLPVGDVGAEAAILDHDGAAIWVLA